MCKWLAPSKQQQQQQNQENQQTKVKFHGNHSKLLFTKTKLHLILQD